MKIKYLISLFFAAALLYNCGGEIKTDKTSDSESNLQEKEKIKLPVETDYLALGKTVSSSAQAELAKNLLGAIEKGGPANAVEFCNSRAIPLTDSMATLHKSKIKRVTDQTRNPANQANEAELAYINLLKEKMAGTEKPEPKLQEMNDKMIGYYPIVTNNLCLKCHEKKDMDIDPATFQKIKKHYPDDKATGYAINELRGLWVVEMDRR